MTRTIGIYSIFVGEYCTFYEEFVKNMSTKFFPTYEKRFYIISDRDLPKYNENTFIVKVPFAEWPIPTLFRFKYFNKFKHMISELDYMFFINSNARCVSKITTSEISLTRDYVFTLHDSFGTKGWPLEEKPFERNTISTCCLSPKWKDPTYVGGRFYGARPSEFIRVMSLGNKNVKLDLKNNYVAKWHDESHINYYFNELRNNLNYEVLGIDFHVPEQFKTDPKFGNIKIMYLDKWKRLNGFSTDWGERRLMHDNMNVENIKKWYGK
jgi:hypothetical protein